VPIAEDLEVVASYNFPHEADLARALLEANEIRAWVLDELQVQQRWYIARALGGVRVAVPRSEAQRAREILAKDHSAALAELPESRLPAAPEEICPRCGTAAGQETRRLIHPRLLSLVLAFVMTAPIRRTRVEYECPSCRHRWSEPED